MSTSKIIRQYKEDILQQWLAEVKQQLPEANEQDYVALRNDIPDLLEDIAHNVDATQDQDTHESFDHGRIRATFENYSLAHVIREYRILLKVVLQFIDSKGNVSTSDRDEIIYEVTKAIEEASEVFFRLRQEKSEKGQQEAEALVLQLQEEGQLRDDFIGTVTHDLRNPLANTISLVELLQSRLDGDPTCYRLLDAVRTSTQRADTLIQNLLDVHLIRSGAELPIIIEQCDIRGLLQASVEGFQHYQGDIQVTIDDPLVGFCDGHALRRASDNLISNAIKYGDGRITVFGQLDKDDTSLNLSVHNQGNPIPEDQHSKIFTRYYRTERKQSQQGWGIGLSLVKGIAEAHGGKLMLNSSEEDGTTFTMRIPIHERRQF